MHRRILFVALFAPLPALAEGTEAPAEPAAEAPIAEPVTQAVVDAAAAEFDAAEPAERYFHGFRIGYMYVNDAATSRQLRSPHLFVIGYEATQRVMGGGWLNVIVVENVSVSGINQSLFIPSMNGIVGFEIGEQIQVGTGINLLPFDASEAYVRQVIAVGYTPHAGAFNVPVHATFIPDVEGHFRLGATVGVNW